jgi:hypothetical protein
MELTAEFLKQQGKIGTVLDVEARVWTGEKAPSDPENGAP